jgi:hypothetical protein
MDAGAGWLAHHQPNLLHSDPTATAVTAQLDLHVHKKDKFKIRKDVSIESSYELAK